MDSVTARLGDPFSLVDRLRCSQVEAVWNLEGNREILPHWFLPFRSLYETLCLAMFGLHQFFNNSVWSPKCIFSYIALVNDAVVGDLEVSRVRRWVYKSSTMPPRHARWNFSAGHLQFRRQGRLDSSRSWNDNLHFGALSLISAECQCLWQSPANHSLVRWVRYSTVLVEFKLRVLQSCIDFQYRYPSSPAWHLLQRLVKGTI